MSAIKPIIPIGTVAFSVAAALASGQDYYRAVLSGGWYVLGRGSTFPPAAFRQPAVAERLPLQPIIGIPPLLGKSLNKALQA